MFNTKKAFIATSLLLKKVLLRPKTSRVNFILSKPGPVFFEAAFKGEKL